MSADALYVLGAVLTVLALRSRLLWSRLGGLVLSLAGAALVAWLVVAPSAAPSILQDDQRLAALLALTASLVLCWRAAATRRASGGLGGLTASTEPDESADSRRRSTWPLLAIPAVGTLGVVGVAALVPASPAAWPPWPLAGVDWLAGRVEPWLVQGALPVLLVVGLLSASAFDTRAPDAAPSSGMRRDEVLYFVLFFLLLGALPLAVALFAPSGTPAPRRDLAERLWLDLLGAPLPAAWPVREAGGLALWALLLVGVPLLLTRWSATRGLVGRHLKRLGTARFVLFVWLVVGLLYVPLRIALGWALGVGTVLHVPELGLSL